MTQRPQRATSADVAARAGVSRTTVSFVLNGRVDAGIPEETRRRVEDAARELGYHPHGAAKALAGGASHTIGLVLRQSPDQVSVDALLAETLWGIGSEAHLGGYRVLVEPLSPGERHYSDLVTSQRVDGLIVSGPRSDDEELAALVNGGFPIIVQGSLPSLAVPSVDVDNRAGARTAVDHLLGLGHRRIACITNAPLAYTAAADRLAGYRDALEAASVPYAPELVVEGAFDAASGWTAMADLLGRAPDMTAVFVASDIVAFGALRAVREAGRRVPGDISVVGFDDIPLARHFDPPLTTIRLPARDLGAAAGRALVERLAGRAGMERTLLPTELVVRESTAPRT
ncbi:MAG TPA: LacI family DNA-binding transcriptional regulator [Candidatus Limnocylindrales bacterium]|nr:LacI family DNA-binding transcriptional regulator [Candidatus Limnocylindrales bacterium]